MPLIPLMQTIKEQKKEINVNDSLNLLLCFLRFLIKIEQTIILQEKKKDIKGTLLNHS